MNRAAESGQGDTGNSPDRTTSPERTGRVERDGGTRRIAMPGFTTSLEPGGSGGINIANAGRRRAFAPEPAYRRMLGAKAWNRLAPEIRARFSIGPAAASAIDYSGCMSVVEMSAMGWMFAQCCRLIGTPLATHSGTNVPLRVTLTHNAKLKGITWARRYRFADGREQTVRSTKRCTSDGRMFEHIGRGFSMELEPSEHEGALYFTSVAYAFTLCGRRIKIPALLTPGQTTVIHEQIDGPRFRFCLIVEHPWFGRTFFQDGEFYSDDKDR